MASVLKHIDNLLSSRESNQDTGSVDEWTSAFGNIAELHEPDHLPTELETCTEQSLDSDDSVLCFFSLSPTSTKGSTGFLSRIINKADGSVLQSLLDILSSDRNDDEISSEMVGLLGYDELELIMQILADRDNVREELHLLRVYNDSDDSVIHDLSKQTLEETFSENNIRRRMQDQLKAHAARPLFSGSSELAPEILPHVYSSKSSGVGQGNMISQFGSKYSLPIGTVRNEYDIYEEIIVPPAKTIPPKPSERMIPIAELDGVIHGSFPGYTTFNRVQSIVFPTAYKSNENLLICAPTGAGKTEVAMMAILRVIDQHRNTKVTTSHIRETIDKNAFKIIYVAPMKALAAEIVRKLGKRLQWLAIEVRELTGDMQLTKAEIAKTQIIVTTPEKWDVVTRKSTGEGEISSIIKLLIIDEVHLLNEERGAVIETIVARTLRQVESSQSMIRIVGLSATLPNYRDVAEFLCVSRQKGLFYFDSSFRPIPLEQRFLGIRGKNNSLQSRRNFDVVTFQKVSALVGQGHQVMIFVHSRKETVKTAMTLRETFISEGNYEQLSCEDHPRFHIFRREIGESRNKEMKMLFDSGLGIHHAGMLRSDRHLMEKMFADKAIKVLCCTATLAWGVNLPAHAVIIKGTQVYDSSKGKFVDLSVLDVLQIFGRAGRPGMESSGEGYICTSEDKLSHYLDAVTSLVPIESQFHAGMVDSLNAEISLGTVSNVRDAVQWLGYTYLFVRMKMNPFAYGLSRETLLDDPQLVAKRNELAVSAARKLAAAKMIIHDVRNGQFHITDVGRIAAKYYIHYTSIEIFNQKLRSKMSEADVLDLVSQSSEFDQIQVRESEIKELEDIMGRVPCEVKNGTDTSSGKVNILLQGFISREAVDDFALVSDMAYVAQNAGRIVRALVEVVISKKWANATATLLGLSKAIESRLWPYEHPLRQFNLKPETLYALEKWGDELSVSQLAKSDAAALGSLVHLNEAHGKAIINASKRFPSVSISHILQPIAADVLRISLNINRAFEWDSKIHSSEPFWLWVEDERNLDILQLAYVVFHQNTDVLKVDFFILVPNGNPPNFVTIRAISDRWGGSAEAITITFNALVMPVMAQPPTKVLRLPFLAVDDIGGPALFKEMFSSSIHTLNALQTQAFWNIVRAKHNSLLCAPAGSGKSVLGQMSAWWNLLQVTLGWVLIITPTRSAALETSADLRHAPHLAHIPVQLVNESTQILSPPMSRAIRVVSARNLLAAFSTHLPVIQDLRLVICDGLEQLDPCYELALSLLRLATQSSPVRFVGLSASLDDARDVAKWLSVEDFATMQFRPRDRDQSLTISHQTFTIPNSASLFKAMAKPAHRAISSADLGRSALVFVPSRGQLRPIARDIITQCTLELETSRGYVPPDVSDNLLADYASKLRDSSLIDFITKGIGFFHPGLDKGDRALMLQMFAEGIIRLLMTPKDSCWTVPIRAAVVIVMGTQYIQLEGDSGSRQVKDYTLSELVRMQSRAVQHSDYGYFYLFCQAEALETYSRFLDDGLPLESHLHESRMLRDWAKSFFAGNLNRTQLIDVLSFSFLAQRLTGNPSYYGFSSRNQAENLSRVVDQLVDDLKIEG